MRVAAGLLILVICSAWGFRRSLLLKRRCTLLRELRLLVEQYSIEISCTAPTLAELAGNSGGEFGRLLCECSGSETDIRRAWSNAVDRLSAEPGCGGEEVSLLRELGRELGTCPAESQLALLKLYSARFDKLISAAEKSRSPIMAMRTPCLQSSGVSLATLRQKSSISASISSAGRPQFSVEKA